MKASLRMRMDASATVGIMIDLVARWPHLPTASALGSGTSG